jgi:hypothetical protein
MFNKKCAKCQKKISKSFDFCPHCGFNSSDPEEYGMLGKNDEFNELDNFFSNPMKSGLGNSMSGSFVEKMFGNVFKMLENEMRQMNEDERKLDRMERQENPNINSNFQLFINGKRVNLPQEVSRGLLGGNMGSNVPRMRKEKPQAQKLPEISEEILKNSVKLPRKEAKSKLSRLGNKVIYELETPGLSTVKNVLVSKLENSIEVKAYTDKAVYFKSLPGKLPLLQYSVTAEGRLVLEFGA